MNQEFFYFPKRNWDQYDTISTPNHNIFAHKRLLVIGIDN